MNKIFKYLMGVFIIGIGIVNTTNADVQISQDFYVNLICSRGYCTNEIYGTSQGFIALGTGQSIFSCEINTNDSSRDLTSNITGNVGIYLENNFGDGVSIYEFLLENVDRNYQGQFEFNNETYIDIGTVPSGYYANYFKLGVDLFTIEDIESASLYLNCTGVGNVFSTIENNNQQECTGNTMTSLECQTEYNLIPIENVTENYCTANFDLIAPTECPGIGEGTGEINRTARYINNQQYPGTASLRLNIEDFLERQTTYNEEETIVDIIGVDADEEYIEDIITKTQITPTAEDFSNLINGLQAFIPYVMIGLLLSFFILLVKKVFK